MDVTSYLLGKKSGGGGGSTGLIDVGASKIKFGNSTFKIFDATRFDFSNCVDMSNMFILCTDLLTVPQIDTSNATNMSQMCRNCSVLQTFPKLNTSKVKNMSQLCNSCSSLKTFPVLDTSQVTNFSAMFNGCSKLTDESLDNILQMCINATSYTGTKTLKQLGISSSSIYPATRIEALPRYQEFLDAGWTIGY